MPSSPRSWSLRTPDHTHRPPTLNAIPHSLPPLETDAEASERHLRTCHEMAELGRGLMRAAAREAERNLVAPIEYPMPGTALEPLCRTADPGLLFTRLTHAVRQTIALETRLRNDLLEARLRDELREDHIRADKWQASTRHRDAPERHPAAPHATQAEPEHPTYPRTVFRAERDECDTDEFAANHGRPVHAVIADIRRDLNLPPDAKTSRKAQLKLAAALNLPPPPPPDRAAAKRRQPEISAYPLRRPDG